MDHHQYHHHDHDQYQHQMTITNNNLYNNIITTPPPRTTMDNDEKKLITTKPQEPRNCPRCNSSKTKFCYYNNYSLAQPRYLCKSCRRYWTEGGSLRNVPVGGGSRKNKKLPLLLPTSSSSASKNLPDLNPPFVFTSSSNPNKSHQNINDLSLSFSTPIQDKGGQGHFSHFTEHNCVFPNHIGMIQFHQDQHEDHHDHNNKTNLGFSLDKSKKESGTDHVVNGGESKMMYHYYGNHDGDERQGHDGNKKRSEGGSSNNELWSGIILGGDSGGPTW